MAIGSRKFPLTTDVASEIGYPNNSGIEIFSEGVVMRSIQNVFFAALLAVTPVFSQTFGEITAR
jgi:hypothetical protein